MKQIRDAWASSSDIVRTTIVRTTLVIVVGIVIIVGILYGVDMTWLIGL